jgi:signal transduction histidine kinase
MAGVTHAVAGLTLPRLEESFEAHRRVTNVEAFRTGVLVTTLIQFPCIWFEWEIIRPHFWLVQGLRLLWLLPALVVRFAVHPESIWLRKNIDTLIFGIFWACGAFICFVSSLHEGQTSPYFLLLVIMLTGVSFVTLWPLGVAITFDIAIYATHTALTAGHPEKIASAPEFLGYQLFLVCMLSTITVFQQLRTRLERQAFEDRVELVRAKGSLEQAYEQLQELDRAKSHFFANVSHELRTPLTLILSPVDELLSRLRPSAERDALKVVRRNAARLLRMIDDLLDLAKLEAGGLRLRVMQVDVGAVAKRVAENAAPAASARGIDLSFSSQGDPPEMFGDPHRIEIILTNLIGNALKFTPAGGRIGVDVFHNLAGTSVEVTDTGPGISREQRERIFERFHQVENSERRRQGGVGIGLALARELTQLHGGSLTVESDLGKGSTFTLFLKSGKDHFHTEIVERRQAQTDEHPSRRIEDRLTDIPTHAMEVIAGELRPSQRPRERILLDRGRLPRVLLAEDEADLRGFIVGVLKESYIVDVAGNGAEALELMRQNRPDLVLTDVMMPEVSGLDLCREIKSDPSLQHIPVILLTARGENEAALEGYEAGADDFVAKPFHTKVLQARIRAHLKMRGLSLQLADQARLASAGTLAAGLAHEVKNPLNAAVNAAHVLAQGGSSRVSNEKLMEVIIDALKRIDGVISALDAHARPADGTDLAPCDVRKAVESTLSLLDHKLKDRVMVHQDNGVTGAVFAPARAFNQVLLNLVDNAIRSGAKNIWIELRQVDKQVSIAVADDGPGVSPDIVHRIFDPFFTTRAEGEGTGLGLHLSRRIARECGGELRYEPRPGGGARFVMEIPAMEQAA